jgi:hypothetical protein
MLRRVTAVCFACTLLAGVCEAADIADVWYCARADYAAVAVPVAPDDLGIRLWIIQPGIANPEPVIRSVALESLPEGIACAPDRVFLRYSDHLEVRRIQSDVSATPLPNGKLPKLAGQQQLRLKPGRMYPLPGGDIRLAYTTAKGSDRDGKPQGAEALFVFGPKTIRLLYATDWLTVTLDR